MESPTFRCLSFREVLEIKYQERVSRNPQYSIRAFARDLSIQPASLFDILAGRSGISKSRAIKLSEALKLTEDETEFFVNLVESKHARNANDRRMAKQRLSESLYNTGKRDLSRDDLSYFTNWWIAAVLEFVSLHGNAFQASHCAKALRIEEDDVNAALSFLIEKGFLKKSSDGSYERETEHISGDSTIPSEIIRGFHKQMLKNAELAIDTQDMRNRKNLSTIFSFDKRKTTEARDFIEKFHSEFLKRFATSDTSNSIFGFSIQLYRLDSQQEDA